MTLLVECDSTSRSTEALPFNSPPEEEVAIRRTLPDNIRLLLLLLLLLLLIWCELMNTVVTEDLRSALTHGLHISSINVH